jgi:hypothetical protein
MIRTAYLEKTAVQTRINCVSNCLSNVPYYDNWQGNIDVWTLETKELYLEAFALCIALQ